MDKLVRAVAAEAIESDATRSILLRFPAEIGESLAQLRFTYDREMVGRRVDPRNDLRRLQSAFSSGCVEVSV